MPAEDCTVRTATIRTVADRIQNLRRPHPIRVAIDGRTAAGKTTFANELASALAGSGREIIRASIDGFHHPSVVRHRQGRLSPDGYYEDARDVLALRHQLLNPLGPSGNRSYVTKTFDLQRDEPVRPSLLRAGDDAILIVDGTFLQRPELKPAWDWVIFLDVPEEVAARRGIARDSAATNATELYLRRYGPAFTRYETECSPAEGANIVIDNSICASAIIMGRDRF
jgi:uridine kinase